MTVRVLVTGGNGMLGKQLVSALREAGYAVRISSRKSVPAETVSNVEWVTATFEEADGWAEALDGVDTLVHLASAPFARGLDVAGTRHLLQAAGLTGLRHLVYISIVGVDKGGFSYFDEKFACEQMIAGSRIPYSIQRATQFHDFAHMLLDRIFLRYPIGFLPRGWRMQPIDSAEVASLLLDAVRQGPSGRRPDAGGPEIWPFSEMARVWMQAQGTRPTVSIPFPFLMGPPYLKGYNLAPEHRVGQVTWPEWVAQYLNPLHAVPA